MHKVHAPHRKSGYIARVEFEETNDKDGKPDWNMFYTPGPKAKAEYRAFTGKAQPVIDVLPAESKPPAEGGEQKSGRALPPAPTETAPSSALTKAEKGLVQRLHVEFSISKDRATELVRTKPEAVQRQLEFFPLRKVSPKNLAGWMIKEIEQDYPRPNSVEDQQRQERAAEAARAQRQKAIADALEKACQSHENRFRAAYLDHLRVS